MNSCGKAWQWTPRRSASVATRGPDAQQALSSYTVLQGLAVAKMALDLAQPAKANEALTASIASASRITERGCQHHSLTLLRSVPAAVVAHPHTGRPSAPLVDAERNPR